jgi:hydrogenase nickel incorporation protein HypB
MEEARENAGRVQPGIEILDLSCTTGEGLDRWYAWIERHL